MLKKTAAPVVLLIAAMIVLQLVGYLPVYANDWLSGWGYRKSHVINAQTGAGTLYQTLIRVYYESGTDSGGNVYLNGKCRTDFGDIRFTDNDETTLLDYWIEEKVDSNYALVWVEVADDLSTNPATIYVYYGKSDATYPFGDDQTQMDSTFLLADHFYGVSLDTNKWTLTQGAVGITGSELVLSGTTGTRGQIRSITEHGMSISLHTKVRTSATKVAYAHFCGLSAFSTPANSISFYGWATANTMTHEVWEEGSYSRTINIAVDTLTNPHIYAITWRTDESKAYQDGVLKDTQTANVPIVNLKAQFTEGNVADENCFVDWCFIRRFVSPEPAHSTWGSEETEDKLSIGEFQAPGTVYAETFFFLNVTIDHTTDGALLVNATLELNAAIILLWKNDTGFSLLNDPSNFCKINTSLCIQYNVNVTAIKLSFWITFRWNYTEGYIDLFENNTKVYGSTGNYATNSASQLFYFEDDLIINSASLQDPDRIDPNSENTVTAILYYQGVSMAPYGITGWTVYLDLAGVTKSYATTCLNDGTVYLIFTAESTSDLYSYDVYALTDNPSVQNKTVSVIIDRIAVSFSVDDEDVWNGTAVYFTLTFKSEYDQADIPNVYFDIRRNGTLWKENYQQNFSDTSDIPWIWYIYDFDSIKANNWNLTQLISDPADITVLWFGSEGPPAAPNYGHDLAAATAACLISFPVLILILIGVRRRK